MSGEKNPGLMSLISKTSKKVIPTVAKVRDVSKPLSKEYKDDVWNLTSEDFRPTDSGLDGAIRAFKVSLIQDKNSFTTAAALLAHFASDDNGFIFMNSKDFPVSAAGSAEDGQEAGDSDNLGEKSAADPRSVCLNLSSFSTIAQGEAFKKSESKEVIVEEDTKCLPYIALMVVRDSMNVAGTESQANKWVKLEKALRERCGLSSIQLKHYREKSDKKPDEVVWKSLLKNAFLVSQGSGSIDGKAIFNLVLMQGLMFSGMKSVQLCTMLAKASNQNIYFWNEVSGVGVGLDGAKATKAFLEVANRTFSSEESARRLAYARALDVGYFVDLSGPTIAGQLMVLAGYLYRHGNKTVMQGMIKNRKWKLQPDVVHMIDAMWEKISLQLRFTTISADMDAIAGDIMLPSGTTLASKFMEGVEEEEDDSEEDRETDLQASTRMALAARTTGNLEDLAQAMRSKLTKVNWNK
jgi:hypothetical protein